MHASVAPARAYPCTAQTCPHLLPRCLPGSPGALSGAAAQRLLAALAGPGLETLVLDFAGSLQVAQLLMSGGGSKEGSSGGGGSGASTVRQVVAWREPPPALAAWDWAHCFLGLLRSPAVTVPEVRGGQRRPSCHWCCR